MTIVRAARPDRKFTILRNEVLQDERLSYRARGVLASILSRPDNWRCSAWDLARDGSEGRRAILTALTELEDAGYLRRSKRQDEAGRWCTESVVYDRPVDKPVGEPANNPVDNPVTEVRLPNAGEPNSGNRTLLQDLDKELDKPLNPQRRPQLCRDHMIQLPCNSCAADRKAKKPED